MTWNVSEIRECTSNEPEELFINEVFGVGEVTEVCGGTGVGKTQLCMQLCIFA